MLQPEQSIATSTDERLPSPPAYRAKFTRERVSDIEPRDMGYLVKDFLPRRGVAFLAGPSTSGKTFLAIEIGLRVSRGEPLGRHRTTAAGVVYVAAEDADGVRRRMKAWRSRFGDAQALQLIPEPPDLLDPAVVEEFVGVIAEAAVDLKADGAPLGLIVIDTLSKAAPGVDQNASDRMGKLMATFDRLARQFAALVLVVAHTPKEEARGIAGWHGQFAAADAVLMVGRPSQYGQSRRVTVAKQKNGRDQGQIAFGLEVVEIGRDDDGDQITSCVVTFNPDNAAKASVQNAALGVHANIIAQAISDLQRQSPERSGFRSVEVKAHAVRLGLAKGIKSDEAVRKRLSRALGELSVAGMIAHLDGGILALTVTA